MAKEKFAIPLAAMEKFLKEAGAERVSEKAKIMLNKVLEERGQKIAKKSIIYAAHANRQTVKAKDIKIALK